MKKLFAAALVLTVLFAIAANVHAQEKKTVPSVKIKNLIGESFDTKDIANDGKPFVINFWATWCKPCLIELNTLNDLYIDWQDETGVKIFAVSIDDTRNSRKVAPFVRGRSWEFDVLIDENSDFRRKLGVNNPPHTFLFNGKGELVWEHNGYAPGDEDELLEKIKESLTETESEDEE